MTRLFYDFLVRWVQQLHWPTSSLTDVKDSFTQAVSPKSFLFYLPLLKDWTFSPTEGVSRSSSNPAPKHIAGRTGTCPMSCPSICEAIQITSIASTEERARMQVPTSDPCEKTGLFAVFIMAKDQINEECLLRNVESWKSGSFPGTSNHVSGSQEESLLLMPLCDRLLPSHWWPSMQLI